MSPSHVLLGVELLTAPVFLYMYRSSFDKRAKEIMATNERAKLRSSIERKEIKEDLQESFSTEVRDNMNIYNYVYSSLASRVSGIVSQNERRSDFETLLLSNIKDIECLAKDIDLLKHIYRNIMPILEDTQVVSLEVKPYLEMQSSSVSVVLQNDIDVADDLQQKFRVRLHPNQTAK